MDKIDNEDNIKWIDISHIINNPHDQEKNIGEIGNNDKEYNDENDILLQGDVNDLKQKEERIKKSRTHSPTDRTSLTTKKVNLLLNRTEKGLCRNIITRK